MQKKLHVRYFLLLLIPSLVILLLGVWMILYAHNSSMKSMQQSAEENCLRATQSLAESIGSLIHQVRISGMNMANQASKLSGVDTEYLTQYMASMDHSLLMQMNNESFLNLAVDRCYMFLFDKNRVINQTSTANLADEYYSSFFRIDELSYDEFQKHCTAQYFDGKLLADVPIGYLQTEYRSWMLVQSIPLNPVQKPTGLLVFLIDESVFIEQMSHNLADSDSICLWVSPDGKYLTSQGAHHAWNDGQIAMLLAELPSDEEGVFYFSSEEKKEYLVTVSKSEIGRIISAQSSKAVLGGLNNYNTSILLLVFGMILMAVLVAMYFSNRNVNAMKRVLDSIDPEHQSGNATNVFSYMQEAIMNAQEREALLSAHAMQQRSVLQEMFLKRLLRGEWQVESDLMQEQQHAALSLEAKAYVVLLFHFWDQHATKEGIEKIIRAEFGQQVYLVQMNEENIACLLLAEEIDLRESIEAVADEIFAYARISTLVSSTVTKLPDVAQAYRQVRMMSRMLQEEKNIQWYEELYQDHVLYNFENSVYMENSLRNNIASGNEQAVMTVLDELYRKNLQSSIYSDHVLRFFAYDLYRMVNHLGTLSEMNECQESLKYMRQLLDSVMEEAKGFDLFFSAVRDFCLTMCQYNQNRRSTSSNETLERITQYVDKHFMDPELSVASIADALGLSSKYLSVFFKEQTNGKISTYIEKKRITHACFLLKTTEMTINDISLASGYALTHTFRVAFKKIQGVTPLDWKRVHAETASSDHENDAQNV